DERFTAVPLVLADGYKVMVLSFREDQFIPVHVPDVDLLGIVLSGQGYSEIGGECIQLETGVMFGASRGVSRGIYGQDDLIVLAYVSPLPGPDDHRGVETGLQNNQFRPPTG
ncbi:MAG: hypothetical protein WD535_01465, partial [Thermaerobacterales bacterium]